MPSARLLVVSAAAVAALALAGCSSSSGGSGSISTPPAGSTASSSTASSSTSASGGASAPATANNTDSNAPTAANPGAPGSASNASGPTPGDRSQPGGDATARAALAAKGWLDASGRVIATKFAAGSSSSADDTAFCNYVFGTVAQVQQAAKLTTAVTFDDEGSGSDGSGGLSCAYATSGSDDVFIIGLGLRSDIENGDSGAAGLVELALTSPYGAILGYAPGTTATTISKAAGTAWLTAGSARVDLTGVTSST